MVRPSLEGVVMVPCKSYIFDYIVMIYSFFDIVDGYAKFQTGQCELIVSSQRQCK